MWKIIFTILFFVSSTTFADGALYSLPSASSVLDLQTENKQVAAIEFRDGYETLTLAVKTKIYKDAKSMLWIFPLPAKPEEIAIDITEKFPQFYGINIKDVYRNNLSTINQFLLAYYFLPVYYLLYEDYRNMLNSWLFKKTSRDYLGGGAAGETANKKAISEVIVYESLSKNGITTELLTAKNPTALEQYLKNKNLALPPQNEKLYASYIDKNYAFVVTHISDNSALENNANLPDTTLGIQVHFPTRQIYFPLRLSSVYGSAIIPIVLYVESHVDPLFYAALKPYSAVEYYLNNKFTKIYLNTPSKYFTDDLWIANKPLTKIIWQNVFIKYRWLITFLIYTVTSMLASLIAGKIVFRPRIKKYETSASDIISKIKKHGTVKASTLMCYGLWNLLTCAGFFLAVIFMRTRQRETSTNNVFKTWFWEIADIRKILFLAVFYIGFLGSMVILYFHFFIVR